MNQILTLARKDLRLLSRDRFALFWIFVFPLLFAVFFGSVMGGGTRGAMKIAVIDEDESDASKSFIARLREKDTLDVVLLPRTDAKNKMRTGKLAAYVALKKGFGESPGIFFGPSNKAKIEVGLDPSHKADGGLLQGVLIETSFLDMQGQFSDPARVRQQVVKAQHDVDDNKNLTPERKQSLKELFDALLVVSRKAKDRAEDKPATNAPGFMANLIDVHEITLDRKMPRSAFEVSFPSAIMWAIMGCVTSFCISIVTERVQGTFLRLRIAPLSLAQLLGGKGLACFLTCITVACFLLALGHFVFGVRLTNPLGLVLAITFTSVCFVGVMMLLATLGKTVQGAAGAGWGILMPMAMLGGGMVPLAFMPGWMQTASNVSPVKWGVLSLEGAIWREFTLAELLGPCGILLAIGGVCFLLGVRNLARTA